VSPTPTTPVGSTTKKSKAGTTESTATLRHRQQGTSSVRVSVRGKRIRNVAFYVDGERVGARGARGATIVDTPGKHVVVAEITFADGTRVRRIKYRYFVATPRLNPRRGSSQFTG
jgi:hypothetical protein